MLYEKMTLKEQILRLQNNGKKQVDIAKELKIHQNYVWKVVNEQIGKNKFAGECEVTYTNG